MARPDRKKTTIKVRPQVEALDERAVPTVGVLAGVAPPATLISTQPTLTPAQTVYQAFLQRRQELFATRQAAIGGRASAQPRLVALSRPTSFPSTTFNPTSPITSPRAAHSSGLSLQGTTALGNRPRDFSGRGLFNNTGLGNRFRSFSGPKLPGVNLRPFAPRATFRAPAATPSPLLRFAPARQAPGPTPSPGATPEVTPPDVKNGPLAKAGPLLATLYSTFSQTGQVDPALASIMQIQGDTVGVMVRGLGDPSALAASLADQGLVASGSSTAGQVAVVEGFIPISHLPELAARADVIGIDPSLIAITH